MAVPRDVRETLEKAGVKFDSQGNIIEDDNEKFIQTDEDDEVEEDEDLATLDEDEDDDNTDDSDDGDSEEDYEDDDEDEVEEEQEEEPEPKPKKRKQKTEKDEDADLPKLTPKKDKKEEQNEEEAISEIRRNLKTLIEKGEALKTNKKEDVEGDDPHILLSELRREAEEFRRMRFKAFADGVKARVNQNSYGAQFDDIINSAQWEEFLAGKAYGSKIGDLYRAAIQSQDTDSVVFFFDDFASKYLTRPSKEDKSVNKQDNLDDLAVPDKTKTSGKPKKRSKWDFEEADYSTKLDEAERGIITREEFIKFSDAFESALSKGRVKPSR